MLQKFVFSKYCAVVLLLLTLAGCFAEESAEDRVKHYITEAEIAVEKGDISKLRELIADNYRDDSGRTKADLIRYVGLQVLNRRSIHLYVSTSAITFITPEKVQVELLVAMTGSPAESRNSLLDLQADIYQFNFSLQQTENSYQLTSASWQPAMLDDLFPE